MCPEIITKQRWAGKPATTIDYQIIPIKFVIIHHTVTGQCDKKSKCAQILQNIQHYHMKELGYWDIGFKYFYYFY